MESSSALRPVIMKLNFPFCSRHCSFCSMPVHEGRNTALLHDFVMALALELKANASEFSDCCVKAIRLGGGCASITDGSDIDRLLRLIHELYHVDEHVQVTMRVCPADINGANMPFYNRAHISRYDLEMISLEPDDYIHLDYLNYRELLPYISSGFLRAKQRPVMGFVLLYGKKTISRWGFRRSVLETVRRDVIHVTLQRCEGEDCLPDDACEAQLQEAHELLTAEGFVEYLPQHYAKPGCEDVYLTERARGTEELGFGPGARTRFDAMETCNTGDLDRYLQHSAHFEQITESAKEYTV